MSLWRSACSLFLCLAFCSVVLAADQAKPNRKAKPTAQDCMAKLQDKHEHSMMFWKGYEQRESWDEVKPPLFIACYTLDDPAAWPKAMPSKEQLNTIIVLQIDRHYGNCYVEYPKGDLPPSSKQASASTKNRSKLIRFDIYDPRVCHLLFKSKMNTLRSMKK